MPTNRHRRPIQPNVRYHLLKTHIGSTRLEKMTMTEIFIINVVQFDEIFVISILVRQNLKSLSKT